MKKLTLFVLVLSLSSLGWAEAKSVAPTERLAAAGKVLSKIMASPGTSIPGEVLSRAKCIAVVPSMFEGGLVVGAESGHGVATCRTAGGWSAPVFFTVRGGSFGLQIGVEGVDLVMIFQKDEGMARLLSSNVELGADFSSSIGPIGGDFSEDTDSKLNTEILTYSYARGTYFGVTLTGASIRRDDDAMQAIYGRNVTTSAVLQGEVAAPKVSLAFVSAVRDTAAKRSGAQAAK